MLGSLCKGTLCLLSLFSILFSGELSSKMVSTGWLRSNLNRNNLKIIDIRANQQYDEAHIPNALHITSNSIFKTIDDIPNQIASPVDLANTLSSIGVDENSVIIIYSSDDDLNAFKFLYALDYIHHKDAAILEGGFQKWEQEERPVTSDLSTIEIKHYKVPRDLSREIKVSKDDVMKSINNNSAVVIDVDSPESFAGFSSNLGRKGHIRGAINHYWKNDLDEKYFWKNVDFLKQSYYKAGVVSGKKVILVSQDNVSSSITYFTLRYIVGFDNIQVYEGGLPEWIKYSELPMETGSIEMQTSVNDSDVKRSE